MPRVGQNPMKWNGSFATPAEISSTTIVHIPMLEGYWKESLEVLKFCIESMRLTTSHAYDLVVLNNGSCQEVTNYLQTLYLDGEIQTLINMSCNVGKVGAWNILFGSIASKYIAYCDCDVLFMPDWLEESIKIMKAYPAAGVVTAQPIFGWDLSKTSTAKILQNDKQCRTSHGQYISEEYINASMIGIGASERDVQDRRMYRDDCLLEREGVLAYPTASHFQFLTKAEVVRSIFPVIPDMALGNDYQFDESLVKLGFLRLSTYDYLVHHMGNKMPDINKELPWIDGGIYTMRQQRASQGGARRTIGNPAIRKVLKYVYRSAYKLLYGE